MTLQTGRVLAVNVVAQIRPDGKSGRLTAIDKRPVEGRVRAAELGLEGDRQMDTKHHGGRDQALYAYAREDLDDWAARLARELPSGQFGENLTLQGIDVSGAIIGERWRITPPSGVALRNGEAQRDELVVEVTEMRVPCATFARWMSEPHWVRRFAERARFGAYLRVVQPGTVGAGDEVEVIHRPTHGVAVGDSFRGLDSAQSAALVAADDAGEIELSGDLRAMLGVD